MSTSTTTTLPAGTWELDVSHSSISFSVRHMMVSKVRGQFKDFTADIVTAEDPLASTVVRRRRSWPPSTPAMPGATSTSATTTSSTSRTTPR